ncbi:hypothetical protein INT47_009729 [Mucor saturninus]|uniref:Uncharacterized protein n=1 Tax=Mucor saturninus TaxID=64648 RepID=A0A8H7QU71_9FUNG|nr:hypothetical protein INT47_009729 [Mucor saturninus]
MEFNAAQNQKTAGNCLNLEKVEAFEDIQRLLEVVSMAITLSPAEDIRDVLIVWRKLDQATPNQLAFAQLGNHGFDKDNHENEGW